MKKEKKEIYEILLMLQELIERDTPKMPEFGGCIQNEIGEIVMDTWYCPNCDEDYKLNYGKYSYCPKCGQKILWDD